MPAWQALLGEGTPQGCLRWSPLSLLLVTGAQRRGGTVVSIGAAATRSELEDRFLAFLEEHGLCGGPTDQEGQDEARWEIDEAMGDQLIRGKPGATLSEATLEEIFQRATRQYRRRAKENKVKFDYDVDKHLDENRWYKANKAKILK